MRRGRGWGPIESGPVDDSGGGQDLIGADHHPERPLVSPLVRVMLERLLVVSVADLAKRSPRRNTKDGVRVELKSVGHEGAAPRLETDNLERSGTPTTRRFGRKSIQLLGFLEKPARKQRVLESILGQNRAKRGEASEKSSEDFPRPGKPPGTANIPDASRTKHNARFAHKFLRVQFRGIVSPTRPAEAV